MRMGVWEIVLIVLLVVILFGHNKIPGMMKNLADGLNVFKKELKTEEKSTVSAEKTEAKPIVTKPVAKKKSVKKTTVKKSVKK